MIIDEGFGTMDKKNLLKVDTIFKCEKIKNLFEFILLITHKEELKEMIPNHIKIQNFKIINQPIYSKSFVLYIPNGKDVDAISPFDNSKISLVPYLYL